MTVALCIAGYFAVGLVTYTYAKYRQHYADYFSSKKEWFDKTDWEMIGGISIAFWPILVVVAALVMTLGTLFKTLTWVPNKVVKFLIARRERLAKRNEEEERQERLRLSEPEPVGTLYNYRHNVMDKAGKKNFMDNLRRIAFRPGSAGTTVRR